MTPSQRILAGFFTFAGVMHFVNSKPYEAIVPDYVPMSPRDAVYYSGWAELAGGLAVVAPATRGVARWWLIGILLAVFPANVHMAMNPEQIQGLDAKRIPRWALWGRLPLQFAAIAWVWRATEPD